MEGRQCIAAGRSPYEEGSPLAHSQLTALGDRLSPGTTESLQRRPQHNEAIIRQRAMQKRARAEAKLALYLKTQPGTAKAAAAKAKLAAFISRQEEKLQLLRRRDDAARKKFSKKASIKSRRPRGQPDLSRNPAKYCTPVIRIVLLDPELPGKLSLAMVLLDRFSLAGSFNIITVVTIRINHIYPMTRVMTPESSEICVMRQLKSDVTVHDRNMGITMGLNWEQIVI